MVIIWPQILFPLRVPTSIRWAESCVSAVVGLCLAGSSSLHFWPNDSFNRFTITWIKVYADLTLDSQNAATYIYSIREPLSFSLWIFITLCNNLTLIVVIHSTQQQRRDCRLWVFCFSIDRTMSNKPMRTFHFGFQSLSYWDFAAAWLQLNVRFGSGDKLKTFKAV